MSTHCWSRRRNVSKQSCLDELHFVCVWCASDEQRHRALAARHNKLPELDGFACDHNAAQGTFRGQWITGIGLTGYVAALSGACSCIKPRCKPLQTVQPTVFSYVNVHNSAMAAACALSPCMPWHSTVQDHWQHDLLRCCTLAGLQVGWLWLWPGHVLRPPRVHDFVLPPFVPAHRAHHQPVCAS